VSGYVAGALAIAFIAGTGTFLVLPILVVERIPLGAAIKRSSELFKRRWGENMATNFGIGILTFFPLIAGCPFVGPFIRFGGPIPVSGRLFMRTRASTDTELDTLAAGFADVAVAFGMEYAFHPRRDVRVLVMVSRSGHCLDALILRRRPGLVEPRRAR